MTDSYSDGWNGAYWTLLSEGGTQEGYGTLDGGSSSGTEEICGLFGCFDFTVSAGSYPNEVSWEVEWVYDGSTLAAGNTGGTSGSFCVTPSPTPSPSITPVPTSSKVPTLAPTYGCPEDFDLLGFSDGSSKCYLTSLTTGSWEDCQAYCAEKDASMLCIENKYQQEALASTLSSSTWIGYERVGDDWQWVDGCSSSYEAAWYYYSDSSSYPYAYAYSTYSYQWYTAYYTSSSACGCETKLRDPPPTASPTLTSKPTTSPAPTPEPSSPKVCDDGFEFYRGNCYWVGSQRNSKGGCAGTCEVLGATMLCIEDEGQQDHVLSMATDKVWLGLSLSDNDKWLWDVEGCESTFLFWGYGEPAYSATYPDSYINTDGTWSDTAYNDEEALCACQAKPTALAPTVAPTQGCPEGTFLDEGGCSNCTVGTFNGVAGANFCEICEIGKVAPEPGATSCALCSAGTQNTDNGKTATEHDAWSDCEICPSGMISTELRSSCIACAAGTEELGHTSCKNCTKGRFSAKDGEGCEDCAIGKFAKDIAMATCDLCTYPRTTMKEGSASCDACRDFHFLSASEGGESMSEIGGGNDKEYVDSCYSDETGLENACCTCPSPGYDTKYPGAECIVEGGTTTETITVSRGFYRPSLLTSDVRQCDPAGLKGGWTPCDPPVQQEDADAMWKYVSKMYNATDPLWSPYCAYGYEGPLCGRCIEGYYRDIMSGECLDCDAEDGKSSILPIIVTSIIILGGVIVLLILFVKGVREFYHDNKDLITQFRDQTTMLFVTFQIFVNLSSVHKFSGGADYPSPFRHIVAAIRVVGLDFFEIFHVDCAVHTNFIDKLYMTTLVPLGYAVATMLFKVVWVSFKGGEYTTGYSVHAMLMIFFFTLPAISNIICSSFTCTEFDDGVMITGYMQADMSLKCYEFPSALGKGNFGLAGPDGHRDEKYFGTCLYAGLMIAIFPLGFPLIMTYLLASKREAIESRKTREGGSELASISFFFRNFAPKFWWMATVDLLRRLMLSSILLAVDSMASQILMALSFSIVFVVAYREIGPFYDASSDILAYCCGWEIVICVLALLLMDVESTPGWDVREEVVGSILFTANILLIFIVVYLQYSKRRAYERAASERRSRSGNSANSGNSAISGNSGNSGNNGNKSSNSDA
mmetsp:Transcript_102534/g.293563  ORF Transcript_102534/g.293563 Transcript_102534/m.293563 type:complete len:1151 (+) Transcript_102534:1637-5089(+)